MKTADIIEVIEKAIETKIGKDWKHNVIIQEMTSNYIKFDIDGERYELYLQQVYM